jgi:hypothetical protein
MEIFKGTCFGHVFFIAYQYTIVEKISLGAWNTFSLSLPK